MFPYFKIFGDTLIYTYPLMMGIAWGIAYQLGLFLNGKFQEVFSSLKVYLISVFIISWFGAKLFFLLTTDTNYTNIHTSANFWLGGGFVFYGGMLVGIVYTLIFMKLKKIPLWAMNILVPSLAIGHGVGRIGCFLAGCCYGKICELPWAIHLHGSTRHPVQLYEASALIFLGIINFLVIHNENKDKLKNLFVWQFYVVTYAGLRIVTEFFRGDKIRGIWPGGLSTSQIISFVVIIIMVSYIFFKKTRIKDNYSSSS
jgi:phosphatidylglycerol:prolipoprotein diacylglycerol transferase